MRIQEVIKLELQGEQLAKLAPHDVKALARGNRALAQAHKTGNAQAFERAARAFSELGIHFRVYL
jgi:hypothetical protein